MIRQHSVHSAHPLAEKLAKNGLHLQPLRPTPLSELIDSFSALPPECVDSIGACSQRRDLAGVVQHDETMANIVDQVAKTIELNLHLARNVVNPIVKAVVADVEEFVKNQSNTVINYISILPIFHLGPWKGTVLSGMVDKYSDAPNQSHPLRLQYPSMTVEQIMEHTKTGIGRFDEELETLIQDSGIEVLQNTYSNVFQRPEVGEYVVYTSTAEFLNLNQNRNSVLLAFLMARRMLKSVPEGVGLSLDEHTEYCSILMEQCGRWLARCLERDQRATKNGDLCIDYRAMTMPRDSASGCCHLTVHGENYNAWLKAGGAPEVIFGAALTDKENNGKVLLEKREQYIKAWNSQARVRENQAASNLFSFTITGLRNAMTRQINELKDEHMVTDSRGVYHDRLVKALGEVRSRELKDIFVLARQLVCDVIFPHTDAERILTRIDEVAKREDGIDLREAALIATIDLVADWVANMITHER